MPIGWAITVVVLCVAVVVLAILMLGVLRQVVPVLERAVPAATPALHSHGPAVGSPLPAVPALGADGGAFDGKLRDRPLVLLFLGEECDACKPMVEEMARADLGGALRDALVVVTSPSGQQELGIPAGLRLLIERDGEVSGPLSVIDKPFAIAVGPDGTVKATGALNTLGELADLAAVLA